MQKRKKNQAAVALGRLRVKSMTAEEHKEVSAKGGKKGGKARAEKLSAARRKAIAEKAAAARWKGKR